MGFYFKYRFGLIDPLCGMKGYNIQLYDDYGTFNTFDSIGCELVMVSIKKGINFKQIKIPVKEREGKSKFGSILTANLKIFIALLHILFIDVSLTILSK
jgi:hypothetical protein